MTKSVQSISADTLMIVVFYSDWCIARFSILSQLLCTNTCDTVSIITSPYLLYLSLSLSPSLPRCRTL